MNTLRMIILALILVQAAQNGLLTETVAFPVLAALAAVFAFLRPFPMTLSKRQRIYGILLLCLFFGVKMRLVPLEMAERFSPFPGSYELNHALAQLLLVLQILVLGMHRFERNGTTPFYSPLYLIPLMGAANLALISDFVGQSPWQRQASIAAACFYALLFGGYLLTVANGIHVRRRAILPVVLCFLLVLAAMGTGIQISQVAAPNVMKLDIFLFRFLQKRSAPAQQGISARSTLQSIRSMREMNANRIALRIQADASPGYLRAYARDRFDGREWTSDLGSLPLQPIPAPAAVAARLPEASVYPIRPQDDSSPAILSVWHATGDDVIFNTLDTALVAANPENVRLDENHCCTADALPRSRPYLLVTGATPDATGPQDALLRRYLQIPDSLSSEAVEVCRDALQGAHTTAGKIQAAIQFFRQHYSYAIGINIPRDQDPISYFLTARPAAHCEFFASGAAVMLRLNGVPCRYVTGFIVTGKSGAYWVARNRDAHAWVEAWDPDQGWVTVEATPPDGLPNATETGLLSAFFEEMRFRLGLWWALFREEGILALALLLAGFLNVLTGTWTGRLILLATAFLGAVYMAHRYRPGKRREKQPPEEISFQRMLSRMDAQARRRGFSRNPRETLHQFAARIAAATDGGAWNCAAAGWYERYAVLRCDGTPAPEALPVLEALQKKSQT